MKFAHELKEAMVKEGFPAHWVEAAVPYGQLKKVIKKVKSELDNLLNEIGLDFNELISSQQNEEVTAPRWGSGEGTLGFQYEFDGEEKFRPKLTLSFEDGLAVDATLSEDTRTYLRTLVAKQKQRSSQSSQGPVEIHIGEEEVSLQEGVSAPTNDNPPTRQVEVPLKFDAEFFGLIQGDFSNLDALQAGEQRALTEEITELSKEMTILTKPSKFSKTDMYRWRELFDIYLQATVFFSTNELDHGSRTSDVAAQKLEWFQSEVMRRKLLQAFKLPASRQALDRFVNINVTLLQNLKFQEINQKALTKILKKFDKRTHLGAARSFPKLIQSDAIMSETMAKAVCSKLTQDLVKVTPQLDDFLCPICFTVCWRPIRMKCGHTFCIRCTVQMQRQRKNICPLCRGNVIMDADTDNIDNEMSKFLKRHFPEEVKEKKIELETAAGKEQFGEYYKHPSESGGRCSVM